MANFTEEQAAKLKDLSNEMKILNKDIEFVSTKVDGAKKILVKYKTQLEDHRLQLSELKKSQSVAMEAWLFVTEQVDVMEQQISLLQSVIASDSHMAKGMLAQKEILKEAIKYYKEEFSKVPDNIIQFPKVNCG